MTCPKIIMTLISILKAFAGINQSVSNFKYVNMRLSSEANEINVFYHQWEEISSIVNNN